MLTLEVRIGQNVAKCNKLGWETVYITESHDCKCEKLSDLSKHQELATIQYQRDVKGVWISGKNYLLNPSLAWF